MGLIVKTAPVAEPVNRDEVKQSHLRVTDPDDDVYIGGLITAARSATEIQTNRALITQTLVQTLDKFPSGRVIELQRCPTVSITSVKYYDQNNTLQTLSSSLYTVDPSGEPGRIVLNWGTSWPVVFSRPGAIEIEYVAGYGANEKFVPAELKHAICFLVAHWYRTREPVNIGSTVADIPLTYDWLIGPYKVYKR